jgi:hypothetical protein
METECASCEVRTGLWVLLQVASISQLTVSRLSIQCVILNISQPYRPPWPVTGGIALLYFNAPWECACTKTWEWSILHRSCLTLHALMSFKTPFSIFSFILVRWWTFTVREQDVFIMLMIIVRLLDGWSDIWGQNGFKIVVWEDRDWFLRKVLC